NPDVMFARFKTAGQPCRPCCRTGLAAEHTPRQQPAIALNTKREIIAFFGVWLSHSYQVVQHTFVVTRLKIEAHFGVVIVPLVFGCRGPGRHCAVVAGSDVSSVTATCKLDTAAGDVRPRLFILEVGLVDHRAE